MLCVPSRKGPYTRVQGNHFCTPLVLGVCSGDDSGPSVEGSCSCCALGTRKERPDSKYAKTVTFQLWINFEVVHDDTRFLDSICSLIHWHRIDPFARTIVVWCASCCTGSSSWESRPRPSTFTYGRTFICGSCWSACTSDNIARVLPDPALFPLIPRRLYNNRPSPICTQPSCSRRIMAWTLSLCWSFSTRASWILTL